MLTNEQAHSLVEHIRGGGSRAESVDGEAVQRLLGRPHNPNHVWEAIRNGSGSDWPGGPVTIETLAALLFEQAGKCPGLPDGEHCLCNVAHNRHDACEWCGLTGEVVQSLDAWGSRHPALHR